MATKTSSMSSSTSYKYDVYLSFSRMDTPNTFIYHLNRALVRKGFDTFRDDMERGTRAIFRAKFFEAIEKSRFAIVVLSKNYASSTWFLDELAKILDCKKVMGLRVVPVFYGVDPYDVRKQKVDLGKALAEQALKDNNYTEKVKKWMWALTEVANLSGFIVRKDDSEAQAIECIVEVISRRLPNQPFSIGNNDLVGMSSRMEEMYLLLDIENIEKRDDVQTIGICGMEGIGKTTLAREVFKTIGHKFEGYCFIDNVKEEYENKGIVHLQYLLYRILMHIEGNIQNYEIGINFLRARLRRKRVLIILDDVDRLEQIEALVGNAKEQHEWFGLGSRVIVTTRDEHLLNIYKVKHIYMVDNLSIDHASQLLRQKAFKEGRIVDEHVRCLSKVFVKYAKGHPLVLKVLGSFLFGRSIEEWLHTLDKLKINADGDILSLLQISFDGLNDNEKTIFLDIACFFKGMNEYFVRTILEDCGDPNVGIKVLIEKSLITMVGDKVWMHDLLQQLGRHIVCREYSKEPGNCNRLWTHKDVYHLQFVNSTEGVGYLSKKLQLLEWHEYPLTFVSSSFHSNKLVELNMSKGIIEQLRKETALPLEMLAVVNLSNCGYLKKTPDFSQVPNLEGLIFEGCKRLSELHPTIGVLKQLVLLNLKGCESLKSLPRRIKLKSLKTFILSGCTKLDKFPEIVGHMDHLCELYLDATAIKELPISTNCLSNLVTLDLRDCEYLIKTPDFSKFPNLERLILEGCKRLSELHPTIGVLGRLILLNLKGCESLESLPRGIEMKSLETFILSGCAKVYKFPEIMGNMDHLLELYMDGTAIKELPTSIKHFGGLIMLDLSDCEYLIQTPDFIVFPNLKTVILEGCKRLRELHPTIGVLKGLILLNLKGCESLKCMPQRIDMESLKTFILSGCTKLDKFPEIVGNMDHLSELYLDATAIKELPISTNCLSSLVMLDLRDCEYLIKTPDFSKFPNLERVILEGCKRLSELHPTIGVLERLILLNLKGCESLESLPQGIEMKSLKTFNLSGCTKLFKFPEIMGHMDHLFELYLDGTAIKELPTSIKHFSGLIVLDLRNCKNLLSLPNVICSLTSLKSLNISGCSHLDKLPENLGSLIQLEKLDACRTAIRKAPSSILLLKNLKTLCFSGCGGVALRFWQSLSFSCLLPMEESISFQIPNSFFGLSSLTSLSLCKCNLPDGAIPENIGFTLSSLQHLYLSENNFTSLPESISQLSVLKELGLYKCSNLQSLPKLPLSIKHVDARECPMLNYSNDQMTIWASNEGFSFIDCRKLSNDEALTYHGLPMSEEHFDLLLPNLIKDGIYHGKSFQIHFPYTRIPEWCSHWIIGSSIKIRLPLQDDSRTWMGFALFVVFLIQEHDDFEEGWNLKETLCHFRTNEGRLADTLVIERLNNLKIGSYGLCIYVPQTWFAHQLNKASHIIVSISTNRPDVEVNMCGMHVIFNQDVPKFTQDIVQTSTEHLSLTSFQHYKQILKEAIKLERSGDAIELEPKLHKQKHWSPISQGFESIQLTSHLGRDIRSLVSIIFQECNALRYHFFFLFHLKQTVSWFFHHSVGHSVVCYLPTNLFDEKLWIGFSLYAALTWSPSVLCNNDLDSETPLLCIDLHSHGSSISYVTTFTLPIDDRFGNLLVFHAPQNYFTERLNQCWGVSAFFRTSIPDLEVEMCGIQVLYKQDLGIVTEMITHFALSDPNEQSHEYYHETYRKMVDNFLGEDKISDPKTKEEEMFYIIDRGYESLQKFLLSTQQAYEERCVSFESTVLHSRKWIFESSYDQMIAETTSTDSMLGLIHLQIMAETPLYVNDSMKWKKYLEDLLKCLSRFSVFITLSLKGYIISVLKPFNPFSTYNLCFPQMEILEWFADYHVDRQKVGIKLPPNLNADNNWRGLAVCASFLVHEHPTAIHDNESPDVSFRLLCHLSTGQGYCLNPVSMFRVTKDKFKWLYVGGFIWLTYIPSCLLLTELNGQSYIEINIYNECQGLTEQNLGARLLYEQDVEEFRKSMNKCMTSFFDNLNVIHQFVDNEDKNI